MPAVPSLARLLSASLLMDGSFYLILTAVPFLAAELGANPVELGMLPVLGSGVYVVSALLFGRLSDRYPRMALAKAGAWLRAGVAVALTGADSVGALMAWMPLLGVANGLFWPALQAHIGAVRPERELGRSLGGFNVSWSTGKMLGFLTGGLVVAGAGYDPALLLAAVLTVAVALVLPAVSRVGTPEVAGGAGAARADVPHAEFARSDACHAVSAGADARHVEATRADACHVKAARDETQAEESVRRSWRRIGWMANFVLFGVGATLNFHYPMLMVTLGFSGRDFGIFVGGIYLFQTLSFLFLTRWQGWHFRMAPLLLAQGIALVSLAVLGGLDARGWIWATAPGIGLGLGLSYSSSIYYSLYRQTGPGRSTGIHEALLGSGTFLLPFLGGVAAQATGSLVAPYVFAAIVLGLAMALESVLAIRARVSEVASAA